jgi:ribonuclease Y
VGDGVALVLAIGVAVIALLAAAAVVIYVLRSVRAQTRAAGLREGVAAGLREGVADAAASSGPESADSGQTGGAGVPVPGLPGTGTGGAEPDRAPDGHREDRLDEEPAREDRIRADGIRADGIRADGIRADGIRADGIRADRIRAAEQEAAAIVAKAEEAAEQAARARHKLDEEVQAVTAQARQLRSDLERREVRVAEREHRLDGELRRLDQLSEDLDQARKDLDSRQATLDESDARQREALERVAGLTADEAKAELMATMQTQAKREAAVTVREIENEAKKDGQQRARKIITLAIQRVASEQTSESVVSVLHLPNDEMKGRIIGREGRNIRAFETVTGVNLIIDDTPEAVLLSCFDPVRREIGRLTLERLVADGRIHPQRIEEVFEQSRRSISDLCVRAGEDALIDVGITDMHPELTQLLGRLRYRTSYGQNVLKHLVESAHIAGMMASELGLDPVLLKRGTLLHDIGKALTHEVQGSHALIGAEIARRYGESEDVVHAIEAHHNEVEVKTVEAVLTQAADAISGGRPGARRESLEAYVKRLERLEQIAHAQPGVEKVYAMQAGREIRVMVKPGAVDDIGAQVIARDVARQVQDELTYPGQIRVTVIRESRATEFAR